MSSKNNTVEQLLRSRSLKVTSTRILVLNIIKSHKTAIPYTTIQKKLVNFDRVTLYRILNTLVERGIVHKALSDNEETFYALCDEECSSDSHKHNHIHFKCTVCHTVSCVSLPYDTTFSLPAYKISHINIEATGVCDKC